MKPRFRDLTVKYKAFRKKEDPFYSSRAIQTFRNKFIVRGMREKAATFLRKAVEKSSTDVRNVDLFFILTYILMALRQSLIMIGRRKARKMLEVPVPVRRLKRDAFALQVLYKTIKKRPMQKLDEKIRSEISGYIVLGKKAATRRELSAIARALYNERANMDYRYK